MKTVFKNIAERTFKPFLVKYLSKTRVYRYKNIQLEIPPEVFHPGFFFSTQFLLKFIQPLLLQGKKLLELGAGSGLLSFWAAKKGAMVTASDINPVAIDFLHRNSEKNSIPIKIIRSDLFDNFPDHVFDIILINPPYYKKAPLTDIDFAWYCGVNGEYYINLFAQLRKHMHNDSEVYMVLCDGCDMDMIQNAARNNGFLMELKQTRSNILEKNFIYKII